MDIDPAIQQLVGEVDFDPKAIKRRYDLERDTRLRPDANRQFVEVTAEFAHYVDDPYAEADPSRQKLTEDVQVVVIGGGFGGLLTAAYLRENGIEDIRIIDKAGDFGGTWYWNRYPGIRCDTESYVYFPLLDKTGYMPKEKYSRGSEIHQYILQLAQRFDLYKSAIFQTAVTGLRWDEGAGRWLVETDRGDQIKAQFVAMANGPLNKPKLPGIPGINEFKGHTFHTSRWDYGYTGGDETGQLTGLADKRVGVIGTGATGVQCIPVLGEYAKQLYVFQRTPAAVDVRANRPTDAEWAGSLEDGWQQQRIDNFNRVVTGIAQEVDLVNDGFSEIGRLLDPTASWATSLIGRELTPEEAEYVSDILDDKKMNAIRSRIDATVNDAATAEALKPWHRRWCKRPLFSDDYLPTFNRPNVSLVDTGGKGVECLTENSVVVDGKAYEVDCLIFATGFEVGTLYTRRAGYDVVGRGGLKLSDYWENGMRTYQGYFARGFPNCLFIGFGQNAVATNMVFMLDEQAKHVAYSIAEATRRGARQIEPSAAAVEDYVAEVAPGTISQLKYWVECTPSYFNGEGTSDDPNGFFANLHPAGTVGFYEAMAQWRDADLMEGLELK